MGSVQRGCKRLHTNVETEPCAETHRRRGHRL